MAIVNTSENVNANVTCKRTCMAAFWDEVLDFFFSLFSVLHHQLEVELERVTRERDQLANQLREDAQFLDNKITFARQQG